MDRPQGKQDRQAAARVRGVCSVVHLAGHDGASNSSAPGAISGDQSALEFVLLQSSLFDYHYRPDLIIKAIIYRPEGATRVS